MVDAEQGEGGEVKADIDENGTLTIRAETQMETFALQQWANDYFEQQQEMKTGVDQGTGAHFASIRIASIAWINSDPS